MQLGSDGEVTQTSGTGEIHTHQTAEESCSGVPLVRGALPRQGDHELCHQVLELGHFIFLSYFHLYFLEFHLAIHDDNITYEPLCSGSEYQAVQHSTSLT